MRQSLVILIIIILICTQNNTVVEFFREFLIGKKTVKSTYDGRFYKIVERKGMMNSLKSYEDSANKLAYMNNIMADTLRYIRNKYYWNKALPKYNPYHDYDNPLGKFRNFIDNLIFRWNPSVVIENLPPTTTNTSYVKDKGAEIAFCLRDDLGTDDEFHKNNILQFVALHELTHIGTTQLGHKTEFWRCFKFILMEAEEANIHAPINFSRYPKKYCGLTIDYNPIFDDYIDSN